MKFSNSLFFMAFCFSSTQRFFWSPSIFVHGFIAFRPTSTTICASRKTHAHAKLHGHYQSKIERFPSLRETTRLSTRELFSSNIEIEGAVTNISIDTLGKTLGSAFQEGETDGIMQLAPSLIGHFSAEEIISGALEASNNNKGQAAGIINAMIASCSQLENQSPENFVLAWEIYSTWENIADELELYPDMVSFCATYSALTRAAEIDNDDDTDFFRHSASQVLERAQRYSKKLAGTKRRKILNTIARKGGRLNNNVIDHLSELQQSYGHDFGVLYEDSDVVVINKPSGMVCFHSRKTTDGKIGRKKKNKKKKSKGLLKEEEFSSDISLEDALIDVGISLSTLNPDALGLVHRIDRGTSGCIVLAKNDDAHAKLVTEFFTRQVKKRYTALVPYTAIDGSADIENSGTIDEKVGGRPARSIYQVEREVGKYALLVGIETKTGRKHQVRMHCAGGLNRPIFLDPLFSTSHLNNKQGQLNTKKATSAAVESTNRNDHVQILMEKIAEESGGRRFFLHASNLKIDNFSIDVSAALPSWWGHVITDLENAVP